MDMQPFSFDTSSAEETAAPEVHAARPASRINPALLDRAEQIAVALLWVGLLSRSLGPALHNHNFYALMAPAAELPILIFVLIRRPTQAISLAWRDWLLAATATFMPLCMVPNGHPFAPAVVVGQMLFWLGMVVQVGAKLSLRRSFGIAPANRGVKTDGLYRFVRHPMYAGYLAMHIGILAINPSWINAGAYGLAWFAQINRLLAEEALLRQDPAYAAYMTRQKWRLIPGIF